MQAPIAQVKLTKEFESRFLSRVTKGPIEDQR